MTKSGDISVDVGKESSTLRAKNRWIITGALTALLAGISVVWADTAKVNSHTQEIEDIKRQSDARYELLLGIKAQVEWLVRVNGGDPTTMRGRP